MFDDIKERWFILTSKQKIGLIFLFFILSIGIAYNILKAIFMYNFLTQ